jgi:phage-related protein
MGDITAIDDSYEQIRSADGINLVKMSFQLKHAVSNSIMKYLHS